MRRFFASIEFICQCIRCAFWASDKKTKKYLEYMAAYTIVHGLPKEMFEKN